MQQHNNNSHHTLHLHLGGKHDIQVLLLLVVVVSMLWTQVGVVVVAAAC